jgi:hypothetical protein
MTGEEGLKSAEAALSHITKGWFEGASTDDPRLAVFGLARSLAEGLCIVSVQRMPITEEVRSSLSIMQDAADDNSSTATAVGFLDREFYSEILLPAFETGFRGDERSLLPPVGEPPHSGGMEEAWQAFLLVVHLGRVARKLVPERIIAEDETERAELLDTMLSFVDTIVRKASFYAWRCLQQKLLMLMLSSLDTTTVVSALQMLEVQTNGRRLLIDYHGLGKVMWLLERTLQRVMDSGSYPELQHTHRLLRYHLFAMDCGVVVAEDRNHRAVVQTYLKRVEGVLLAILMNGERRRTLAMGMHPWPNALSEKKAAGEAEAEAEAACCRLQLLPKDAMMDQIMAHAVPPIIIATLEEEGGSGGEQQKQQPAHASSSSPYYCSLLEWVHLMHPPPPP